MKFADKFIKAELSEDLQLLFLENLDFGSGFIIAFYKNETYQYIHPGSKDQALDFYFNFVEVFDHFVSSKNLESIIVVFKLIMTQTDDPSLKDIRLKITQSIDKENFVQ